MSMLSAQADRLRDRADELRMFAGGVDAPYIVPSTKEIMKLSMQSAAVEMREAADTIISLRNMLQESERHNRINLEVMGEMYHPEIVELMQSDVDARDELIRDLWKCLSAHIESAINDGGCGYPYSPQTRGCGEGCVVNGEDCSMSLIERRMRKLGIEVGE